MAILWWFGAGTTMAAVRWLWWFVTGKELDTPAWWVVPVVFSTAEVVKWYYKDALNVTLVNIVKVIENGDWLTTIGGLVLVLSAGVGRVLNAEALPWWHYVIILIVAVAGGRLVTFVPERVTVDSVRNIIEEVEHYRGAS
jgi:hypothetical protein